MALRMRAAPADAWAALLPLRKSLRLQSRIGLSLDGAEGPGRKTISVRIRSLR